MLDAVYTAEWLRLADVDSPHAQVMWLNAALPAVGHHVDRADVRVQARALGIPDETTDGVMRRIEGYAA